MLESVIAWLFGAFFVCCTAGVITVKSPEIQRVLWPLTMILMCVVVLLSILATSPYWTSHG